MKIVDGVQLACRCAFESGGISEALLGDLVRVLAGDDLLEVAFDRGVARRVDAEVLRARPALSFEPGSTMRAITRTRNATSSTIPRPSYPSLHAGNVEQEPIWTIVRLLTAWKHKPALCS